MTKREIILETAEYYKTHNRGFTILNSGEKLYAYLGNQGDMCAVGRCLINPEKIQTLNFNIDDNLTGDIKEVASMVNIEDELKPEYRGHSIDFWHSLQKFHDNPCNWEKEEFGNRLTDLGSDMLNTLLGKYESK